MLIDESGKHITENAATAIPNIAIKLVGVVHSFTFIFHPLYRKRPSGYLSKIISDSAAPAISSFFTYKVFQNR
jgi:hypothetical protein